MLKLNLIGLRFGRLTVVSELQQRTNSGKVMFRCICDCGKKINVVGSKLKSGHTKSCSCIQKEKVKETHILNKTHGLSRTAIYSIYHSMIARCYNPNSESYSQYGGRGIKVCNSWLFSFENFVKDIGDRPSPNHSLDRIDVNGDYFKDNCRWATKHQQENNKTNNRTVVLNGEKLTIAQLVERTGIAYNKLYSRLFRLKWDVNKAISCL